MRAIPQKNGRFKQKTPFSGKENRLDTELGFLIEFYKKQGCMGMGEVLPNMEFFDPKMQNLYRCCEQAQWPLLFDCSGDRGEGYGLYDDIGLPQLRQALEKYPKLTFIGHGPAFWAELDMIGPNEARIPWLNTPLKGEGAVVRYMREYKNLWVDLSASSGYFAMMREGWRDEVKKIRELADSLGLTFVQAHSTKRQRSYFCSQAFGAASSAGWNGRI